MSYNVCYIVLHRASLITASNCSYLALLIMQLVVVESAQNESSEHQSSVCVFYYWTITA